MSSQEAILRAAAANIQAAAAAANVTLPASLTESLRNMDMNALQAYLRGMGLNVPPLNSTNPAEKETKDDEDAEDDSAEAVSYKPYRPLKVTFGKPHPDPVVENSTLAAVEPPDICYNLALPADVIAEGKLSNLQLEALLYGCQRHQIDLPQKPQPEVTPDVENAVPQAGEAKQQYATPDKKPLATSGSKRKSPDQSIKQEEKPYRAGFMLGDGAGMGKGKLTVECHCAMAYVSLILSRFRPNSCSLCHGEYHARAQQTHLGVGIQ